VLQEYALNSESGCNRVAETFLDSNVKEAEISIHGYKCYRKDRNMVKDGRGGGVILYVKDYVVSYDYNELNEHKAEAVWCKIKTAGNTEIVVGACYKSQAANENELQDLYTAISQAAKRQVLVMGDLISKYQLGY
jgi:hypothetical protein